MSGDLLLLTADGAPPIPKELVGQFVLSVPFAPGGPRPGQSDNIFFGDELDTIWKVNPAEATRIRDFWSSRGANTMMAGPIYTPGGYDGQYDATNWIGQGDRYAAFLEFLTARLPVVYLCVLPDSPPYFLDYVEYDWDAIERDITPVLMHPKIQSLANSGHLRVFSQWECYSTIERIKPVWAYIKRVFPKALRFWHNPPNHLSPGMGYEDEQLAWRSAIAGGLDGLLLQVEPIDSNVFASRSMDWLISQYGNSAADLNIIERGMLYGYWDMWRRFNGVDGSPWGAPFITERGVPAVVEAMEGTAYFVYHARHGEGDSSGRDWYHSMRKPTGSVNILDGLPR